MVRQKSVLVRNMRDVWNTFKIVIGSQRHGVVFLVISEDHFHFFFEKVFFLIVNIGSQLFKRRFSLERMEILYELNRVFPQIGFCGTFCGSACALIFVKHIYYGFILFCAIINESVYLKIFLITIS